MKPIWLTTIAAAALLAACADPAADPADPAEESGLEDAAEDAESMLEGAADAADDLADAAGDVLDETAASAALAAVLADARRDNDRARDVWRNPAETLAFFDVQPDHTVVEALPGGGWYTRILLPYTEVAGRFIAINYPMSVLEAIFGDRMTDERRAAAAGLEDTFPVQASEWGGTVDGMARFGAVPAEMAGTADRVLYIRALHNMARTGNLDMAVDDAWTLLAPGGVVGVVQHRAPADEADDRADGSRGYMREADMIAAFEARGFVFEGSSEINANPNDPADADGGVWTRMPSSDSEEARAIGETDRMTLRFRKPD
ncbi:MAG: class I SAM-dependent methyltransferase [Oceanicaulis sp.]|nr:class I SAM-dependent methyltransferase [Oceanicaulis sp.]